MRILTVCKEGNVRSVTAATLLKRKGHDALSCGVVLNAPETLEVLCAWADKVLVAADDLLDGLPDACDDKIVRLSIGRDRWGRPMHADLVEVLNARLGEVGF